MARGKKSLMETTDLPIVETDKEEGNIPYFVIDEEYGIACDDMQEMLCKRVKASKTIKGEDGKESHVETYYKWNNLKYMGNFTSCIEEYAKIKSRDIKKNKLIKSKDFKDVVAIQNEVKQLVADSLSKDGLNKEFLSITSIIDERAKLEEEIKHLKQLKEQCINDVESLIELVKEKRRIIIKETEPKKHRVKKEED